MANGNGTKRFDAKAWIITFLTAVVMAQSGFLAKIAFNDMPHETAAKGELANQLADLRAAIYARRADDYSAWGYQLNVNKVLFAKLAIPVIEWPEAPEHLKRHP